jgi:uncharacterized phage protein gp47/JayE
LALHVEDPTITTQDINVSVVKFAQYDDTTVTNDITAALQAYLSADTWDWGGTIYLNELIALVSNCYTVDRVASFTTPSADVVLTGDGPLATLGTVTISIS